MNDGLEPTSTSVIEIVPVAVTGALPTFASVVVPVNVPEITESSLTGVTLKVIVLATKSVLLEALLSLTLKPIVA